MKRLDSKPLEYHQMKKKTWTDVWRCRIATQGKYLHVFSEQMLSCHGRRIKFTFDATVNFDAHLP